MELETGGLHPTTELCLEALQALQQQREVKRVLDMGCGGGILSILCAHLWEAQVLGVDIAEKAVEETRAAIVANGLEGRVASYRSNGFAHEKIRAGAPYDLIIINLLAEPIIQWAGQVKKHLAPDGIVLLSGILNWQEASVLQVYNQLGFDIKQLLNNNPWVCDIACHKAPA